MLITVFLKIPMADEAKPMPVYSFMKEGQWITVETAAVPQEGNLLLFTDLVEHLTSKCGFKHDVAQRIFETYEWWRVQHVKWEFAGSRQCAPWLDCLGLTADNKQPLSAKDLLPSKSEE